jgi:hypothetical protein
MFGTDNPFFPPLGVKDIASASWPSTEKVTYPCVRTRGGCIQNVAELVEWTVKSLHPQRFPGCSDLVSSLAVPFSCCLALYR